MTGLNFEQLVIITRGTTWAPLKVAMKQHGVVVYKGRKKCRILPLDQLEFTKQMVKQTTSYGAHKPIWDDEIARQMIERCQGVKYDLQPSDTGRQSDERS
jgi:hypothetical protein